MLCYSKRTMLLITIFLFMKHVQCEVIEKEKKKHVIRIPDYCPWVEPCFDEELNCNLRGKIELLQ